MVGGTPADAARVRGNPVVRWRVLLGAALITIAAGGVVFAHRAAQQPPTTRYLVLAEQVAAGEPLVADHLGSVAVELPEVVDAVPEDRAEELLGRVAARTLSASTLVSASDLLAEGQFSDPDEQLVPVALDPTRMRAASMSPGRAVHVLGTTDGTTSLITTARVVSIGDSDDGGIGSSGTVRVELAVQDIATAEAVVDANISGTLTLVLPTPGIEETR